MKKTKIFMDVDGVLAVFFKDKSFEDISVKGYWISLPEIQSMIETAKRLIKSPYVDLYILTSVIPFKDNHAEIEKRSWLKERLPLNDSHIICVPYGEAKIDYLKRNNVIVNDYDILLDDFSQNLHEFEKDAIGIKVYNGINGTKGTWHGYSVHTESSVNIIYNTILGIVLTTNPTLALIAG